MVAEKISFEQLLQAVEPEHQPYIQSLHSYLLKSGCKAAFEQKKNGPLASYKHGKPPRAVANVLFRKSGMLVRVYGENISGYGDFLNTLPQEMAQATLASGDCKRLISGGCSPKCTGYDFKIADKHLQKCRYGCFDFLVNSQSRDYIKTFIENELKERICAK